MKPNIDRRGRIARALSGLLCIAAGGGCMVWAWPDSVPWRWTIALGLLAAGLFQLYEARKGWCIARACGLKTPM